MAIGDSGAASMTGVYWDARPTERLVRELGAGAGAAPSHDASVAWGRLAIAYAEAAVQFTAIAADVRRAWQSDTADSALGRLDHFGSWLAEVSTNAVASASSTSAASSAFAVAALAMPDAADVDALQRAHDHVFAASSSFGGALIGAAALAEDAQADEHARASRVMESYEAATAAVTIPVVHPVPPAITAVDALGAESASNATQPPSVAASTEPAAVVPLSPIGGVPVIAAREKSAFSTRAPRVVSAAVVASGSPVVAETPTAQAVPMAPAPLAAHTSQTSDRDVSQRPDGAAASSSDNVGVLFPEGWINFAEMESIAATPATEDAVGGDAE